MAPLPFESFVSFTKTWHDRPYPTISPTRPELSVSGKNVVITGGGTGIGKAAAIAFAQAGAKSVSIIGRRIDRLEASKAAVTEANPSTQVVIQTGDVTDHTSISAAFTAIDIEIDGKIDIFINNAGVLAQPADVVESLESEVRRSFDTNFFGSLNALQAFAPLAAPGAKLLNVSSAITHFAPLPEIPKVWHYAAAKAAALKMVEYYAAENPGVHVVSIQPGIISTEINPRVDGPDSVELPAHFLVWLASKEAEFLRNKFAWANWDVEELIARADEISNSSLLRVFLSGVDF